MCSDITFGEHSALISGLLLIVSMPMPPSSLVMTGDAQSLYSISRCSHSSTPVERGMECPLYVVIPFSCRSWVHVVIKCSTGLRVTPASGRVFSVLSVSGVLGCGKILAFKNFHTTAQESPNLFICYALCDPRNAAVMRPCRPWPPASLASRLLG